jgi:serine phosphatase RsbU (regulator of sigma subunit)
MDGVVVGGGVDGVAEASEFVDVTGPIAIIEPSPPAAEPLASSGLGEPGSPAELAQRLAVVVAGWWPDVVASDLFLPRPTGALRGTRDPRAGESLLSALRSAWGPIATQGLMPVRAFRLSGDAAGHWGPTMSAPVFCGSSLEGFVVVQRQARCPDFKPQDLDRLRVLADDVGRVLPQARARSGQWMKTFMRQDMVAAREVQRTFLPRFAGENSARVRVVAEYLPAYAVGGDFYDFIDLGEGRVLAAIGDVAGKGVNAALIMARVSSELRWLATETSNPAALLSRLNRSLAGRLQDDRFATVACALLDAPGRRWVVANAGHPAPVLRRRDGGILRLGQPSGPPIGIETGADFQEQVYPAEAGDILVLVTDGALEVVESSRPECATIGQSCLTDLILKAPHDVDEIAGRIVSSAESASERDDVALLGLQLAE